MCWSTPPVRRGARPPEELNAQAWHDAMNAKFFTYVHMLDLVVKRWARVGRGHRQRGGRRWQGGQPIHAGRRSQCGADAGECGHGGGLRPHGRARANVVNPGATHTERLQSGMQATARMLHISEEESQATRKVPWGAWRGPKKWQTWCCSPASMRQLCVTGWCSPWMARPRPWWF